MSQQIVTEAEIGQAIDQALADNRIVLFMKGTPEAPACGFSYRIRQVLSARSGWPTIPQLFVDGTLVGGCDIVTELHESGELAQVVA